MIVLLELKERLKAFYGRFAGVLSAVIKFVFSFTAFSLLNQNIGFMADLKNPVIPLVFSLICAFLPYGAICFLVAGFMLVHIYSVSFEIALITAVLMIIIALLYYGFQPVDGYWLILTPIAFLFKVPFVIPLLAGLAGSLVTAIPVACGAVMYYIIMYVKQNAGLLTNDASVDITQKYVQLIRAMVSNKTMLVMIAACAAGILVVYLVRTMSVDYAWIIAIVMGAVAQLAVIFIGDFMTDISVSLVELIVGVLFSIVIAGIYHFFVFAVDYTRTEFTQFEDDDYVYYVKAVPKIVVTKADVKVQRINNHRNYRGGRN